MAVRDEDPVEVPTPAPLPLRQALQDVQEKIVIVSEAETQSIQHDARWYSMLLSSSILIPGECEQICVGRKRWTLRDCVRQFNYVQLDLVQIHVTVDGSCW